MQSEYHNVGRQKHGHDDVRVRHNSKGKHEIGDQKGIRCKQGSQCL